MQISQKVISQIHSFEEQNSSREFLEKIMEKLGVSFEAHNAQTYFLMPTPELRIPSYPGLSNEGQSITFDREFALQNHHIEYMSWEHPIVKTAIDLFLNSPLGNISIVHSEGLPRDLYFEFIISSEVQGKLKAQASEYFPFTPFRALVNIQGKDLTGQVSKKAIDQSGLSQAKEESLQLFQEIPRSHFQDLFNKAKELVATKQKKMLQASLTKMTEEMDAELLRVEKLMKTKDCAEYIELEEKKFIVSETIKNSQLKLDALRIILPYK